MSYLQQNLNMWDHCKLIQAVPWRITYTVTDFTFQHFNIIIYFSYWHTSYINSIPKAILLMLGIPTQHNLWGTEISIPYKLCVYILFIIYLFMCSSWLWPFGVKHVAENNTINSCVLTGFIIILKPSSANLENCNTHHTEYWFSIGTTYRSSWTTVKIKCDNTFTTAGIQYRVKNT